MSGRIYLSSSIFGTGKKNPQLLSPVKLQKVKVSSEDDPTKSKKGATWAITKPSGPRREDADAQPKRESGSTRAKKSARVVVSAKHAFRQQERRRRKNANVAPVLESPAVVAAPKGRVDVAPTSVPRFSVKPKKRPRKKMSASAQLEDMREGLVDLETADSVLCHTNLRALLNRATFAKLPLLFQRKLAQLLPSADNATLQSHSDLNYKLSFTALHNEFFAKACATWKEKLADGEFTPENMTKKKQECEKERSKLDPWKVKNFEPIWGDSSRTTEDGANDVARDGENDPEPTRMGQAPKWQEPGEDDSKRVTRSRAAAANARGGTTANKTPPTDTERRKTRHKLAKDCNEKKESADKCGGRVTSSFDSTIKTEFEREDALSTTSPPQLPADSEASSSDARCDADVEMVELDSRMRSTLSSTLSYEGYTADGDIKDISSNGVDSQVADSVAPISDPSRAWTDAEPMQVEMESDSVASHSQSELSNDRQSRLFDQEPRSSLILSDETIRKDDSFVARSFLGQSESKISSGNSTEENRTSVASEGKIVQIENEDGIEFSANKEPSGRLSAFERKEWRDCSSAKTEISDISTGGSSFSTTVERNSDANSSLSTFEEIRNLNRSVLSVTEEKSKLKMPFSTISEENSGAKSPLSTAEASPNTNSPVWITAQNPTNFELPFPTTNEEYVNESSSFKVDNERNESVRAGFRMVTETKVDSKSLSLATTAETVSKATEAESINSLRSRNFEKDGFSASDRDEDKSARNDKLISESAHPPFERISLTELTCEAIIASSRAEYSNTSDERALNFDDVLPGIMDNFNDMENAEMWSHELQTISTADSTLQRDSDNDPYSLATIDDSLRLAREKDDTLHARQGDVKFTERYDSLFAEKDDTSFVEKDSGQRAEKDNTNLIKRDYARRMEMDNESSVERDDTPRMENDNTSFIERDDARWMQKDNSFLMRNDALRDNANLAANIDTTFTERDNTPCTEMKNTRFTEINDTNLTKMDNTNNANVATTDGTKFATANNTLTETRHASLTITDNKRATPDKIVGRDWTRRESHETQIAVESVTPVENLDTLLDTPQIGAKGDQPLSRARKEGYESATIGHTFVAPRVADSAVTVARSTKTYSRNRNATAKTESNASPSNVCSITAAIESVVLDSRCYAQRLEKGERIDLDVTEMDRGTTRLSAALPHNPIEYERADSRNDTAEKEFRTLSPFKRDQMESSLARSSVNSNVRVSANFPNRKSSADNVETSDVQFKYSCSVMESQDVSECRYKPIAANWRHIDENTSDSTFVTRDPPAATSSSMERVPTILAVLDKRDAAGRPIYRVCPDKSKSENATDSKFELPPNQTARMEVDEPNLASTSFDTDRSIIFQKRGYTPDLRHYSVERNARIPSSDSVDQNFTHFAVANSSDDLSVDGGENVSTRRNSYQLGDNPGDAVLSDSRPNGRNEAILIDSRSNDRNEGVTRGSRQNDRNDALLHGGDFDDRNEMVLRDAPHSSLENLSDTRLIGDVSASQPNISTPNEPDDRTKIVVPKADGINAENSALSVRFKRSPIETSERSNEAAALRSTTLNENLGGVRCEGPATNAPSLYLKGCERPRVAQIFGESDETNDFVCSSGGTNEASRNDSSTSLQLRDDANVIRYVGRSPSRNDSRSSPLLASPRNNNVVVRNRSTPSPSFSSVAVSPNVGSSPSFADTHPNPAPFPSFTRTPPNSAPSPSLTRTPPNFAQSPSFIVNPPNLAQSPSFIVNPPNLAQSPSFIVNPPNLAQSPSFIVNPPNLAQSPSFIVNPPNLAPSPSFTSTCPNFSPSPSFIGSSPSPKFAQSPSFIGNPPNLTTSPSFTGSSPSPKFAQSPSFIVNPPNLAPSPSFTGSSPSPKFAQSPSFIVNPPNLAPSPSFTGSSPSPKLAQSPSLIIHPPNLAPSPSLAASGVSSKLAKSPSLIVNLVNLAPSPSYGGTCGSSNLAQSPSLIINPPISTQSPSFASPCASPNLAQSPSLIVNSPILTHSPSFASASPSLAPSPSLIVNPHILTQSPSLTSACASPSLAQSPSSIVNLPISASSPSFANSCASPNLAQSPSFTGTSASKSFGKSPSLIGNPSNLTPTSLFTGGGASPNVPQPPSLSGDPRNLAPFSSVTQTAPNLAARHLHPPSQYSGNSIRPIYVANARQANANYSPALRIQNFTQPQNAPRITPYVGTPLYRLPSDSSVAHRPNFNRPQFFRNECPAGGSQSREMNSSQNQIATPRNAFDQFVAPQNVGPAMSHRNAQHSQYEEKMVATSREMESRKDVASVATLGQSLQQINLQREPVFATAYDASGNQRYAQPRQRHCVPTFAQASAQYQQRFVARGDATFRAQGGNMEGVNRVAIPRDGFLPPRQMVPFNERPIANPQNTRLCVGSRPQKFNVNVPNDHYSFVPRGNNAHRWSLAAPANQMPGPACNIRHNAPEGGANNARNRENCARVAHGDTSRQSQMVVSYPPNTTVVPQNFNFSSVRSNQPLDNSQRPRQFANNCWPVQNQVPPGANIRQSFRPRNLASRPPIEQYHSRHEAPQGVIRHQNYSEAMPVDDGAKPLENQMIRRNDNSAAQFKMPQTPPTLPATDQKSVCAPARTIAEYGGQNVASNLPVQSAGLNTQARTGPSVGQRLPVAFGAAPTPGRPLLPKGQSKNAGGRSGRATSNRPPPGDVNLERSYQICQAVIANSPNRDQLRCQLKPIPTSLQTTPKSQFRPQVPVTRPAQNASHAPDGSQMKAVAMDGNATRLVFVQPQPVGHSTNNANIVQTPNTRTQFQTMRGNMRAPNAQVGRTYFPAEGQRFPTQPTHFARAPADGGYVRPSNARRTQQQQQQLVVKPVVKPECTCNLEAMVLCKECGAFCHGDCVSQDGLCEFCVDKYEII